MKRKTKSQSQLVRVSPEAAQILQGWASLTGKSVTYLASGFIKHNLHGSLLAHFQALTEVQNAQKLATAKVASIKADLAHNLKPL
jgi:hypothetical protein